jgi:hemolysin activation/secretion protein
VVLICKTNGLYQVQVKFKNFGWVVLAVVLNMSVVNAQPPADAAASQAERLIQEEQLRQQQRARERDERRQQPESMLEHISKPAQPETAAESDRCTRVARIQLDGVSLLSESAQQALIAPYIGRCLTLDDINNLLAAITNQYFERGYVTSRAYIPPQDLSGGVLQLVVIEGKVQSLDTMALSPRGIDLSFPTGAGEVLNLRDLEQGIDQLNRLPSNHSRLQLFPGDEPGMSRIEIGNTPPAGGWRMVTSLDNSGQESTGERQAGINYSLDNPFGLVDFMSLHVQTNAESVSTGSADSVALHYDLPLGYWNFDLDAAAFEYKSRVAGAVVSFDTSGESNSQSLRVSRLWHRDQSSKSGGRFYLWRRKNLNFIEDVMLETSSRTLASAGLEAWYQRNIRQGGWNISLACDRGLDALGAQNDDGRLYAEPRAEFSKVRFNAGYYRELGAGMPLNYSARLNGQHSRDILYSLEQISIGSPYSVRGYKEQGASGNKGAWLRQELGGSLPASSGWLYDTFGIWELALGVDWGKVRDLGPGQESHTELKGWGLGLHSRGGSWNLSMEWAKAWDAPEWLPVADHDFYFSLGYAYQPEP